MRIGPLEYLLVFGVILLLFGPKKLPELARGMGEAVKEFKKGQKDLENTINEPIITEEQKTNPKVSEKIENAQEQAEAHAEKIQEDNQKNN